jgi:hypothetical protein
LERYVFPVKISHTYEKKELKKKNWSQPSTPSKQNKFKKKNQIWEWESSLQGMEVRRWLITLLSSATFSFFWGVKFCTLANLWKLLIFTDFWLFYSQILRFTNGNSHIFFIMLLEGCLNCYRKVSYIITPCHLVTSNFGLRSCYGWLSLWLY